MRPFLYFILIILASYLSLPVLAQPPQRPKKAEPFSQSEWVNERAVFLNLYNNNSPEQRKQAFETIDKLYNRFLSSDIKYAIETMEFLLQALSVEQDKEVVEPLKKCLGKLLDNSSYLEWLTKKHKEIVILESAKLRFIDVLSLLRKAPQDQSNIITIITDLITKEKYSSVRISAINFLSKNFPSQSIDILIDLVKNADPNISKLALNTLSELKASEILDELIKLLANEQRKEIKEEIGRTLEKITNEHYGTNFNDWREWRKKHPLSVKLLQGEVDAAITKGTDFLMKQSFSVITATGTTELIFYTLIKSGVKVPEPIMKQFVDELLTKKLERTYNVALLSMVLVTLDKTKYLDRLVQCAEFLLANQSPDGNWFYGTPTEKFINTDSTLRTLTGSQSENPERVKQSSPTDKTSTMSVKKIKIKMPPRRKESSYDNSNTQYAILGLRACAEGNIEIPQSAWADAEKHLLESQNTDGGWGYKNKDASYGSMTAGGLGSLIICKYYQNKKTDKDSNVKQATEWLTQNFTVLENPRLSLRWHYYYLYALERAGSLLNTELFGPNEWYPVGGRYLLREQKENGCWNGTNIDTCFAILFLRRATKPLKIIISGDDKKQ